MGVKGIKRIELGFFFGMSDEASGGAFSDSTGMKENVWASFAPSAAAKSFPQAEHSSITKARGDNVEKAGPNSDKVPDRGSSILLSNKESATADAVVAVTEKSSNDISNILFVVAVAAVILAILFKMLHLA